MELHGSMLVSNIFYVPLKILKIAVIILKVEHYHFTSE